MGRHKQKKKKRYWTQAEIDYLKENAGIIPCTQMANHLGRTYDSVEVKAGRLGVRLTVYANDFLTGKDIETMLNLYAGAITRAWSKRGLKRIKKRNNKYLISHAEFIRFCGENQDLFTTIGTDTAILKEADWYEEKHKKDLERNYKCNKREWSDKDVGKLKSLYSMGFSISKIAEKMERSDASIKYKLYQCNIADEALK